MMANDATNAIYETAERLAAAGVSVIPISPGTKEPVPGFRWGEFATRIADGSERLDWFLEHELQLAVVAGPVSGHLVILDYDGAGGYETHAGAYPALRAYPRVRTGSNKHHVWVRSPVPVRKSVMRLSDGSRLEVRAGTHYTLCPPSRHPSGGYYRWEVTPWNGIPLVDLTTLGITPTPPASAAIKNGAVFDAGPALTDDERDTLVRLMEPAWSGGQKHDVSLALAGWLANLSVPEDDAAAVLAGLTEAGDDRRQVARAVRDTYRKATEGVAVAGWARLVDRTNPLVAPATAKQLDLVLRSRVPQLDLSRPSVVVLAPADDDDNEDFSDGITLEELQHKTFAPLHWVVEDMLPEGAALLAGKAKSKKSWLILSVGLAVAMPGSRAMGIKTVEHGRVLYLDLEGKQERIKRRAQTIVGRASVRWPSQFHVFTDWPQSERGLRRLRAWLRRYPDTRLVVVDVFADLRGPTDPRANMYEADRMISKALNQLAEEFHCTIVLVHHTRKMKADDVFDEISGTTGLQSGVSTMWVLSRMPDGQHTLLSLRGRDLEDDEPLALKWDDYACIHVIEGLATQVSQSMERKAILDALEDDQPRTLRELATIVGKTANTVGRLLNSMIRDAQVDRVGIGTYAIVRRPPQIR